LLFYLLRKNNSREAALFFLTFTTFSRGISRIALSVNKTGTVHKNFHVSNTLDVIAKVVPPFIAFWPKEMGYE
jgi:hypothetical protein